jgi:hypothetical protein
VNQVWSEVIGILRRFKNSNFGLIQEAVKDYLRRFIKKFEEIGENEFYGNIEYSHLPGIFYNLFRTFTFEEYQ